MTPLITPLAREQMAWRVAQDIPHNAPGGTYVNLGIGMPELVANHLPDDADIMFHCENGILGMGPVARRGEEDFDLITAGKKPVTVVPGAAFFDSTDSFAMIRGGHIDIAVLGAFQISRTGDLANWSTGDNTVIPAVGGAMDLAQGAKRVFVITNHQSRDGAPKIVETCTYPLTGRGVVSTVFTDLAVIDVTPAGLMVREIVDGLGLADLQAKTGAPLTAAPDCRTLARPQN
ncbi:MAG: 3-oxoacid CoA-transferase subunit B [Proteobacteria bacterium]|nr:3-oxoacid CoA-transferase subunit B [Pseudomonadota bacterium]MDA1022212.1 3-oxoacid CoA-transferase subunit B [Pseudomonadota bacterium]